MHDGLRTLPKLIVVIRQEEVIQRAGWLQRIFAELFLVRSRGIAHLLEVASAALVVRRRRGYELSGPVEIAQGLRQPVTTTRGACAGVGQDEQELITSGDERCLLPFVVVVQCQFSLAFNIASNQ